MKPLLADGRSSVRENPLLNAFFSLDFSTVIAIIMSLLALLFTYDSCSSEREKGTLKLTLANAVGRSTILLGKIFSVTITLLPILLFCYVLSALIILLHPGIFFSASDWVRISMMFLCSLLVFVLFMLVGLFVSTRVRSSVTSIITCLFIWITFLFIIPNLAVYVADSFVKTESLENLRVTEQELWRERNKKFNDYRDTLEQPDWWMHWNYNTGSDGLRELYGATGIPFCRSMSSVPPTRPIS